MHVDMVFIWILIKHLELLGCLVFKIKFETSKHKANFFMTFLAKSEKVESTQIFRKSKPDGKAYH